MNRAALAASCIVAALCFTPPAIAAEDGVVSVIKTRESAPWIEEATSRLAGELRGVGFRVRVVDRAGRGADAGPVDARGEVATIAIVATPKGAEVDVWISDKVTDELRVKRVVEADRSAPNAASDLAVRSVELLRASLLQATPAQRAALAPPVAAWLAAAPSLAASEAPSVASSASPTSPAPAASRSASVPASRGRASVAPSSASPKAPPFAESIETGVAVLTGAGAGFAFAPALVRAGVLHRAGLGARVTGVEALASTRTGASGASVAVRQWLASVDAIYAFASPRAFVAPHVSAGGGVFVVDADGRATLPAYGLHPRFATGSFDAGAGVALRLRPELALVSDVGCLVMPTEPTVTIGSKTVFRTGRPLLLASLGVAAHF